MLVKKAMILAAGRGQRLRPLTDTTPKPLIQVGSRSLIEYHLISLANIGVSEVIINLAHLGDQIQQSLGNGEQFGLNILYSLESEGALETAGGIRHALPLLGDMPFLVINGDIRCDLDLSQVQLGNTKNMHLVMVPNPQHHPDGDFWLDQTEIPATLYDGNNGVSTRRKVTFSGIGLYRPSLFSSLPPGPAPLAPVIQKQITEARVSAQLYEGYWTDVGTIERLEQARLRESKLP